MNVKELFKRKEILEDELLCIDHIIRGRWEKLTGFGCGYFAFVGWAYNESKDVVSVGYESYGNCSTDNIPARFFKEPNYIKAKKEYDIYFAAKKKKDKLKAKHVKEEEEKRLFKALKEKYGNLDKI